MKRNLVFKDGTSDKFWNIEVNGNFFTVQYGKTGTGGQTQTKSFENEEQCRKEADKLVNEKLKKGYGENSVSDFAATWKELTESSQPSEAFLKHFSFLTESEEDITILEKLSRNVLEINMDSSGGEPALVVAIRYADPDFDEPAAIRCSAPFAGTPAKGLPISYVKAARVHNGMYFEDFGGGAVGFFGIGSDGKINSGGWEPEAIEEGDNEEFIERLENKDLSVSDMDCIIEFGQNWILSDPLKKTTHKEPGYLFISHEDCELVSIEGANRLTFGPILLRVFAQRILDEEFFSEVYS
ncbi:WGR domain-containing protein [Leptospira gomenensis]|uniref:WGR domain-containing protein n=1 Tax=Leptospira gomenensis TaxID=2484974 RepID=A0A5F1YD58_9LEPT|nr:WGR domain-containing protein [Leptospira gomenensis]TGK36003.1 WGR domain-containing protein [Leptospira gomenensis]TGK39965.1 WGR domain-containing protein [Leptospira gomenensis]TGK51415.1 WGR domain-containing protein [Leptospira gomenensis]TGK64910.1 WGR domain-containing protein [Leptospira gomenensis]